MSPLYPGIIGTWLQFGAEQVRGDHYVTIKVTIPKDVSSDERKLLEELQTKGGGKVKEGKKSKGSKVRCCLPRAASRDHETQGSMVAWSERYALAPLYMFRDICHRDFLCPDNFLQYIARGN